MKKEFDWTKASNALNEEGGRAYVMFENDTNGMVVVLESEFDSAFSDAYGFDENDRLSLKELELGWRLDLSGQWFVVHSKINSSMLSI